MIIGVVGPIASGKSVLSDMLVESGFVKFSLSGEVREEAASRGIKIARTELQDLGNEMREKHGNDYWMRRVLEKIKEGEKHVIEGIRNHGEVENLLGREDFVLIGVSAPVERRFQWIMMRGKDSDPSSLEGVKKIEARDLGHGEQEHGQQVSKAFDLAKIKIVNDGTQEELRAKVEKVIKELGL